MDFLSPILGIVVFGGMLFFLWRGMSDTNRRLDDPNQRMAGPDVTGRSEGRTG